MEITRSRNKLADIALILLSGYVLIGGITSGTYLIMIVLNGLLHDWTGWLSFFLCFVISLATIVNNFYILKLRNRISEKHLAFNIYVCLLQIFSIAIDGFQFKYKQGLGIVTYWKVMTGTDQSFFGCRIEKFDFNFTFKFNNSNFFLIGVDFLILFLFLLFLWIYRTYKSQLV